MKTLRMYAATLMMAAVLCLSFAACGDDDASLENTPIVTGVEIPFSDTSNPFIVGQALTIRGVGFTSESEILFHAAPLARAFVQSDLKAEIISVSNSSISFIIPKIVGKCDILLKQSGKSQSLGSVYVTEVGQIELLEYMYAIGGNEETPSLYLYNPTEDTFRKISDLGKGRVIKFVLSGIPGSGIAYYFQDQGEGENSKVNLYSYNLKTNKSQMILADWLTKFKNGAKGQAIGMIGSALCGVECSQEKGFEVIQFGSNGVNTVMKSFPANQLIEGKQVTEFFCEDDNLLFNYDKATKCVLVTGNIRLAGERNTSDCLLSLNMETKEVKMIRDTQSDTWFQTLNTGKQTLLLETKEEKTTIKELNASTLETVSVVGTVNDYVYNPVYSAQFNTICWPNSSAVGTENIMKYDLNTHNVKATVASLPYIEAIFSIKY